MIFHPKNQTTDRRTKMTPTLILFVAALGVARAAADERLEGRACRSVHLQYGADNGTHFYNVESTKLTRLARFGNGWVKPAPAGEWLPLLKAKFTGDRNPVVNINAGLKEDRFYLAAGGEIANDDVKLWQTIERQGDKDKKTPTSLL